MCANNKYNVLVILLWCNNNLIRHKVHNKSNALESSNCSPRSPWKNCLHETGPWCQSGHCYSRETVGKSSWLPRQSPPSQNQTDSLQQAPQIRPSFFPIAAGPTRPDTQWELQASRHFNRRTTFKVQGQPPYQVQFASCLFVVSPETPERASSKQACAVTRVPGRTKGFDSQSKVICLFFFFFFQFWCWKDQGRGRDYKTACLSETAQSELEPGSCPAVARSLYQKTPIFYLETPLSVKYSVPVCRKMLYIWDDWVGKKAKGGRVDLEKWDLPHAGEFLSAIPGLQREKQKQKKTSYWSEGTLFHAKLSLN